MKETSRRLLPPITSLQSLTLAARYGNFSKAADELGLTQSAISRQIAQLEDWLGKELFTRVGRRVMLNREGHAYADAVAPGLDIIRRATAQALTQKSSMEFTIATLPGFGMRWLAPRLPKLTVDRPELVINFVARSEPFVLRDEGFDAAIHFGQPDWQDAAHDLLFRERAIPVCSPQMLAAHPVEKATDLLEYPLLVQTSRSDAWHVWAREAGVIGKTIKPRARFEQFLMLAQAAAAGSGAALIPSFLIEPELASGTLVCPMDVPIARDEAYYLVYPHDRLGNPAFRDFREWLLSEAAAENKVAGTL